MLTQSVPSMALSYIQFVSNNPNEFQKLIAPLVDDYTIQVVDNLEACHDKQQNHDAKLLTIIDADVLQQKDSIASITEKIVGKIIVLGHNWPEPKQIEAIAAGLSGYCDKKINALLFSRVVASVHKGEVWIPRHLIPKVINLLISKNFKSLSAGSDPELILKHKEKLDSLTEREKQVAMMIADGKVNKQIAPKLFITERTVKAHLSKIFQKLDVPDRIHLVIFIKNLGN